MIQRGGNWFFGHHQEGHLHTALHCLTGCEMLNFVDRLADCLEARLEASWAAMRWYTGIWLLASSKWGCDKLQAWSPSIHSDTSLFVACPLFVAALLLMGLGILGRCITGPQVGFQDRMNYLDYVFND